MAKLTETTDANTSPKPRTIIVTGASKGIGAGVTKAFIERGYNVVANSLHFEGSAFTPTRNLALVDGDIGQASTAAKVAETAIGNFGSIDGVINNAGIFFTKPFTEILPTIFSGLPGLILRAISSSRNGL